MLWTYRIIEILDDGVLVSGMDDEKIEKLTRIYIPKFAQVGDLIRRCEHNFYDVVHENGDFVHR